MATASKAVKAYASSNGSDWYEMDGINSFSVKRDGELLDATDFKSASATDDYTGAVKRIAGLASFEVEVSGDYEDEATGQGTLRSGKKSSAQRYIKILPNGTVGHTYYGYVRKQSFNGEVKGKCEVTYTMVCTTAPVAV